jgi:glycerol-3-phosphate acyltransferase PlsY
LTLALDLAKGILPILAARLAGASPQVLSAATVAAVVGHVWPLFAGFRGGRGVATAAGAFLVVSPPACAISGLVFAVIARATRLVSLASLAAATTLPVATLFVAGCGPELAAACASALILFVRHRDNLSRLRQGTEPRFTARDRAAGRRDDSHD